MFFAHRLIGVKQLALNTTIIQMVSFLSVKLWCWGVQTNDITELCNGTWSVSKKNDILLIDTINFKQINSALKWENKLKFTQRENRVLKPQTSVAQCHVRFSRLTSEVCEWVYHCKTAKSFLSQFSARHQQVHRQGTVLTVQLPAFASTNLYGLMSEAMQVILETSLSRQSISDFHNVFIDEVKDSKPPI